ncbi:hypothetical protein D9M69_141270 [compost metagenome]
MSPAQRHPLAPSDLAMLDGVLRRAGFHQRVDLDDQDSLRLAAVFLVRRFQAGVTTADILLAELQNRDGQRTPRQIETANLERWENDGGAPQRPSAITRYTGARRLPWPGVISPLNPTPRPGKGPKSGKAPKSS